MTAAAAPLAIVGAGLAGLIAAHAWPQCRVYEAAAAAAPAHRALLRFRSDAVARLVGVEFRKVRVHKGISLGGRDVAPSIPVANAYSLKVIGRLQGDRSIWDIAPVDRWIAPENFYEQLVDSVGARITWGANFPYRAAVAAGHATISTVPLPAVLAEMEMERPSMVFTREPIEVMRFEVPGSDVFQTIYFPGPETSVYRASLTGSLLIIESAPRPAIIEPAAEKLRLVLRAFGLPEVMPDGVRLLDATAQRFGKIAPVDEGSRKRAVWALSHHHRIYSLGRFATWRNILLDDVVDDIAVIKRLLRADDYELARAAS